MINLTATLVNYCILCPRKLWLFSQGIQMELTSDVVYDGKLLHETSYPQRAAKHNELEISAEFEGITLSGKIDFYDAGKNTIHETKRSDKVEEAHEWQVKFYIWLLEMNGISGTTAILEYPKLRRTHQVTVGDADRNFLKKTTVEVVHLTQSQHCPPTINSKICKSCSYYELCYICE